MKNPIIAALDVPDLETAVGLAGQLKSCVGAFKIGSELFTSAGPEVVRRIRALGSPVFLDLKFYDIPNTVAKAVAAAVRLDVQMLTLHVSGGSEMLKAADESARETARSLGRKPPLLLGVTVLTSFDNNELNEVGVHFDVARQVERLANIAVRCGLGGLVCSPLEVAGLRQFLPSEMQLVTPGVRASGAGTNDQKRVLAPHEALAAGANWLVVGRPIYTAVNPVAAVEEILATLPRF
ncbi:MAG: orotidine-5'-phosphate decarboxylase [Verrucomicrobiota bacterium]